MTSSNGNISALLALCVGNSPFTGEFPSQRSVTRSFDVFFDLLLKKRLSKQSRRRWLKKPLCPLWRHCNECKHVSMSWRLHILSLRHSPRENNKAHCHTIRTLKYPLKHVGTIWCYKMLPNLDQVMAWCRRYRWLITSGTLAVTFTRGYIDAQVINHHKRMEFTSYNSLSIYSNWIQIH